MLYNLNQSCGIPAENCESYNSTDISKCVECWDGYLLDTDKSCQECSVINGCTSCLPTSRTCTYCNTEFPTYFGSPSDSVVSHDGSSCIFDPADYCRIPNSGDFTKCSVCLMGFYLKDGACSFCSMIYYCNECRANSTSETGINCYSCGGGMVPTPDRQICKPP